MLHDISTERLILRPVAERDFEDICEYGTDEETGKYMIHWPKTREEVRTFILDCMNRMNSSSPSWLEFAMELKASSKVIGNITLQIGNGEAEIGWISNRQYWSNGYMSEAVSAIIPYAFSHLAIGKIFATCTDRNAGSYKVMEKCGMKRTAEENNHKAVKNGAEVAYTKLSYSIYP
jgi:[ribosomal protein S5]-alanine N-acetyltransferase